METTRLAHEPSQQSFGEGSGLAGLRAQKSRTPEYSRCSTRQRTGTFKGALTIPQDDPSSRPLSAHHAQRARAAHRVLEQLERDGIADLEVIERSALPQIRAMKINLACIRQP